MAGQCSMPLPDRPTPVKQVFWGRNFRLDIGRLFLFEIRQDAVMPAYFENDNALKSAGPLDGASGAAAFFKSAGLLRGVSGAAVFSNQAVLCIAF